MKIEIIKIEELKPYQYNAKLHPKEHIEQIANSIKEFGNNDPIAIDENNTIIEGHGRLEALKKLGFKEVEVIRLNHLTGAQKRAYIIAHNKLTMNTGFDLEILHEELEKIEAEFKNLTGFTEEEISELEDKFRAATENEDEIPEEPKVVFSKMGDLYILDNKHKVLCGDTTNEYIYQALLEENKIDLVFTDPPYGMKKENKGVLNDNLNYDDLLEFNRKWIPLTFKNLKENGSWYCWGIDEPLMDIYSEILKPMIRENKITFRNLITWNKGNGQGQMAEMFKSYAVADEKCLFVMCGIQSLTLNADNYWEKYEPIRKYLYNSRVAMGWDVPTMKKIVGHSDISGDHWTGKSQFNMPTKKVYNTLKREAEAQKEKRQITNTAFGKKYEELRAEYEELRAYFNNTHDNMNNVWEFSRTSQEERENTSGHATPKPIALCMRGIKSSSRKNELVFDGFLGSGSTLIASDILDRRCYGIELDPKYVDVIIKRYIQHKIKNNEDYNIILIRDNKEINIKDTTILD